MAGGDTRPSEMELTTLFELDLGADCGQLRAAPVDVDDNTYILLVHAADAEVDPYMKMFFYPEDTLTFTLVDASGSVCWERDLGRGVVPGIWFCPVFPFDLDGDGSDEVLWGERAISIDDGSEVFCADREEWDGHSDVVQPTRHAADGEWYVYTVRESDTDQAPRVVTYDDEGERVWSAVESGHIDMGWTARLEPDASHVAMAIRIGNKTAGTSGFGREGVEEFRFDASTGEKRDQPHPLYGTVPVDLDGDGLHELAYGGPRGSDVDGDVRDGHGELLANFDGTVAMASKFLDHPGEQLLTYTADGRVTAWGDASAEDTDRARDRYDHPYYEKAQRLTAVGYNWVNLGGL